MKLKRNLFFLFTITVFGIASVLLDVYNYNPYEANTGIFINVFVSLFVAIAGILSFIIYYSKLRFSKDKNYNGYFFPSIRQSALVSLTIIMLLIFKTLKILDWWVAGPLVIAVILLELFFQTNSPFKSKKTKSKSADI